jgi:hypothetical protein
VGGYVGIPGVVVFVIATFPNASSITRLCFVFLCALWAGTLHGKQSCFLHNVLPTEPQLYVSQPNQSNLLYCDWPNYRRRICLLSDLSDRPVNVGEDLVGEEQDSAHESLTKNLKLEIGVYVVLVLQVLCR